MTEQEYIDATDLQKVRTIKDILLDITVENSNAITQEEFDVVYPVIRLWESKIVSAIEVADGTDE